MASFFLQVLKDRLLSENKGKSLMWLQKTLIECCFVKLVLKNQNPVEYQSTDQNVMEPVPFYYTCNFIN